MPEDDGRPSDAGGDVNAAAAVLRRVGDEDIYQRYDRVGLGREEADRIFTEHGRISPVLATLGAAEATYVPATERREVGRRPDRPVGDDERLGVGSRAWRTGSGPSVVLSIRLDHHEIAELRRRAQQEGLGTSVLARALIRRGLGDAAFPLLD